jgi:hypothetical protein
MLSETSVYGIQEGKSNRAGAGRAESGGGQIGINEKIGAGVQVAVCWGWRKTRWRRVLGENEDNRLGGGASFPQRR